MASPLTRFPWPCVLRTDQSPAWIGDCFQVGTRQIRILQYGTEQSHWSEELTAMHETEAGREHPIDAASRRLAVDSMRGLLRSQDSILLDVGCSSGFVLEDLRHALPQAQLIGSDYIYGPLEGLARRMPSVPLLQFDLRRCPLPNDCVDGITCLNVLEHIDQDKAALAHIFRILKPGGVAHIEVPAGPQLFDIYDECLMHHRRYQLTALKVMARAAGFIIRKATHLGVFIYPAFWFVKKRNRRFMKYSAEEKQKIVGSQIRSTKINFFMAALIKAEIATGKVLSFPCGIRCVVVLQKPV